MFIHVPARVRRLSRQLITLNALAIFSAADISSASLGVIHPATINDISSLDRPNAPLLSPPILSLFQMPIIFNLAMLKGAIDNEPLITLMSCQSCSKSADSYADLCPGGLFSSHFCCLSTYSSENRHTCRRQIESRCT